MNVERIDILVWGEWIDGVDGGCYVMRMIVQFVWKVVDLEFVDKMRVKIMEEL